MAITKSSGRFQLRAIDSPISAWVKLKTPVSTDLKNDKEEIEKSYRNTSRFDHIKMFPNSQFEFTKWNKIDIIGFSLGFLGVFFVILVTILIANIGA